MGAALVQSLRSDSVGVAAIRPRRLLSSTPPTRAMAARHAAEGSGTAPAMIGFPGSDSYAQPWISDCHQVELLRSIQP